MARRTRYSPLPFVDATTVPMQANGGAYEATERYSRELALWRPPVQSADGEILRNKQELDAKARDRMRNDGYVQGGAAIHRDSIVGNQFVLNAQPDYELLGADETWAEEFQKVVESKFTLLAESDRCWLDVQRTMTFTSMVRLAVTTEVATGEALSSVEWIREGVRPIRTAILAIDPDRLSNPNNEMDTDRMRRGIERNAWGAPIRYHIREAHPGDRWADEGLFRWNAVDAAKPWGRPQIIHLFEPLRADQSRGVAAMASVLKEMRMTKRFQDITLQNAVVNATYAAAIESELPPEEAYAQIGEGQMMNWAQEYLGAIADYTGGSKNLYLDGVKIPHLFPGTKLKMFPAGTPGGVGSDFEQSLLRHIAAALGLSYEQFSRDYTKTNYSSARASMNETWKHMMSKKKVIADRYAGIVYSLVLEEWINAGEVPLPAGKNASHFYEGLNREAYCAASWIGASRGQIDELKETEAAEKRLVNNLTTAEWENAKLGQDWRKVFKQRAREKKMAVDLGIEIDPMALAEAQAQAGQPGKPGGKPRKKQDSKEEETA